VRRRDIALAARVALQAALAALLPAAASPQAVQAAVEIGAARLRHRDVPTTGALTAGAAFRSNSARHVFAGAGGLTLAHEGQSSAQGLLTASLLGRPGGRYRWELGGAATAFGQGLFVNTGAYIVAREHFALGRLTGWAGLAYGGVEDEDVWSPTRSAEIVSSFGLRTARLTAAAVVVDTRSEPYGVEGSLVTDPITYTDASLGARWAFRRRVEIDARGGMRFISRGALTTTGRGMRAFGAVDATVWVTARLGVVAAMGRQLSDLARGTPDTRFAAFGLRISLRDAVAPARRSLPPADRAQLLLTVDTLGHRRLVVTAPRGDLVELAASFTSWEPIQLVRRGTAWELDRPLASGAHRVLIRVDGGPWLVPANLPSAADDFGGTVGIITIP
jgi:hypothetical protein